MKTLKNLKCKKFITNITIGFLLIIGGINVLAQCLPLDYHQTFKKVYREHKMYFEGVIDLNNDGKPDAFGYQLQANNTYKNLAVLLNDGNGGFGDPLISNTSSQITGNVGELNGVFYGAITTGDLDNDSDIDFVVRSNTTPVSLVSYENNGSGSFTQK